MTDEEYEERREAIRVEIQAAIRDADWARIRLDMACADLRDLVRERGSAKEREADRG